MSDSFRLSANGGVAQMKQKSFYSLAPFDGYIYKATNETVDFKHVVKLTKVSGATPLTCPAGRLLHMTGRKLNPGTLVLDSNRTTPEVLPYALISVYDPISFLTGFIIPNNKIFGKFDQELPIVYPYYSNENDGLDFYGNGPNLTAADSITAGSNVIGTLATTSFISTNTAPTDWGANFEKSSYQSSFTKVFLTPASPMEAFHVDWSGISSFNVSSFGSLNPPVFNYLIMTSPGGKM